MKKIFFRNWSILFQVILCFSISEMILIFFAIYYYIKQYDFGFTLTTIIITILFVLVELITIFFPASFMFSKIHILESGLKLVLFKKEILNIDWKNIDDIKKCYVLRTQSLELRLKNKESFKFNVNKRILKSLISFCNEEDLKNKLKKIKLLF